MTNLLRLFFTALTLASAFVSHASPMRPFTPLKLGQVRGLAFDQAGNLYVPDLGSATLYKITPAVFDVWMRILQRVPRGVLMLYSEAPETQANLRREAQARGIDPQRLLFAGPLPHAQHLARLRLADLFLDTWPYNAHTTGSDALWAGLPVLTLQGATFPSRVGSSLLQAVGLPELVTHDTAAYEELAVELACLPPTLARLRGKLAAQLPQAPLYDTPAYVRRLEDLFAKMYERARAGLPAGCIR